MIARADARAAAKPAGAYRPPGARGTVASDVYTRRDDDAPSSGASTPTPMFRGGKPSERYRSAVPGAPPGGSPATDDKKKKQRSKKNKGEEANGGGSGAVTPDVAAAEKLEALKVEDSPVEDANQKKVRNLLKKVKPSAPRHKKTADKAAQGHRRPQGSSSQRRGSGEEPGEED